jgi:thiol-disulfide isomerase/thioredoxin
MKRMLIAGSAVLALAAAGAGAVLLRDRAEAPVFDGKPELIAATFSSAWCTSCRILEPRLEKAIPAFRGRPVKFIDFDLTFGPRAELKAEADAQGLGEVYNLYSKATGYTVLVDADTGEVVEIVTAAYSKDAIRDAVDKALTAASES